MVHCNYCGRDLTDRPHSRQTHIPTGKVLNLCLAGCRWFPDAYPSQDWENWLEEVINPQRISKPQKFARKEG